MRPLQHKFDELEDLLRHHRRTLAQNTGVPFLRLVYRPEEEVTCQRLQSTLTRTLKRDGVPVHTISCHGMIFAHYERRGRLDQLFDLDQTREEGLDASIRRHAQKELEQALLNAADKLGEDGAIFLKDVAFLYPYLQLSPVLDACTNRIVAPMALVIFYPGEVDVNRQLLFLGKRASGYYRTRDLI